MSPEDDLARRIAAYVATQVPPDQRDVVTRTVCMVIATLMADPAFTYELVVVKALREENLWLRNNYMILKQMMDKVGVKPTARKPAASGKKRAASPKRPAGSSTSSRPRKQAARPKPSAPNSSFRRGFNEMRG